MCYIVYGGKSMDNFATLIIDIKNSRKLTLEERYSAQHKLYDIVLFINDIYKDVLISKVDFSAGDSIQGVFKNLRNAFNAYLFIRNLFYPFEIRCGLGYSSINDYLKSDYKNLSTNMLDGEAYHFAQYALMECKKRNKQFLLFSNSAKDDILVNEIMSTVQIFLNEQTASQADICNMLNLIYPINYHNLNIDIDRYCKFFIHMLNSNVYKYKISTDENYLCRDVNQAIYLGTRRNQIDDQNMDYDNRVFYDEIFPTRFDFLLADFLGTSRQNITKRKETGHTEEIRRLELSVMSYLENIYDKGI